MTPTTLTIEATAANSASQENTQGLIKTDRIGRIHVKAEHREALLDKFERSGMSGQQFAKHHGIKYSTFANWRQQRRIKLKQYPVITADTSSELENSLTEVVLQRSPSVSPSKSTLLQLDLGGGVSLCIKNESELSLAGKLINQLRGDVSL